MAERKDKKEAGAGPETTETDCNATAPIVTLTHVNGTDVTGGATAPVSPPLSSVLIKGRVSYPKCQPADAWYLHIPENSRRIDPLPPGTPPPPTLTLVSDNGTTVVKDYEFYLQQGDISADGMNTLTVEVSNVKLIPDPLSSTGGTGQADAQISCSGFGPGGPPHSPPTPVLPPQPVQ
jgi:hypothetical protein